MARTAWRTETASAYAHLNWPDDERQCASILSARDSSSIGPSVYCARTSTGNAMIEVGPKTAATPLICAGVLINELTIESLFASDGEIGSTFLRLLILCFQSLAIAAGVVILAKRRTLRFTRSGTLVFAVCAIVTVQWITHEYFSSANWSSTLFDPPIRIFIALSVASLLILGRFMARADFYTLVITMVVILGLAEAFFRAQNIGSVDPQTRVVATEHPTCHYSECRNKVEGVLSPYQPNTELRYIYPDNPRGYFGAMNEVVGTVNSLGIRGVDRTLAKAAGTFRIAVLGDSFAFGYGVKDEDTLPARLELALNQGATSIQVLNFGVTGSNTSHQIALLERYALQFQPDVVIVLLYLNDADVPDNFFQLDAFGTQKRLMQLRRRSHLTNFVVGTLERTTQSAAMIRQYQEAFLDTSGAYAAIKQALIQGKQLADTHDFDFVVAVYPILFRLSSDYPFHGVHDTIKAFCDSQSIYFVDLFTAFRGQEDRRLWVHDVDHHPNELAHQLAARELSQRLLENDLGGGLP